MPNLPTFLGWDAPPIKLLSDWLFHEGSDATQLDLSGTTIVLPSATAVRQLQQTLVQYTNEQEIAFLPPDITTIGGLPERLYPHRPAATESFQQLAWFQVITETSKSGALDTFLPFAPSPKLRRAWQSLANAVAKVHRELSGDGLRFSDIVAHYQAQGLTHEVKRWQQLQLLQDRYFDLLDAHQVWDIQSARVIALQNQEISVASETKFVIAGCSDLNKTLRGFLSAIAAQTEFIVFAPDTLQPKFDEVGCLIPEKWDATIPAMPLSDIKIARDATHQAELVLDTVAAMPPETPASDILIATPDAKDESEIARQLKEHQLEPNSPTGVKLTGTRILVLLRLVRNYIEGLSFDALSSLLRHPDIATHVLADLDITMVLAELTEYHEARLPLDATHLQTAAKRYPNASEAATAIQRWCAPLLNLPNNSLEIHKAILSVLDAVYGERTYQRDTQLADIKSLSALTHTSTEIKDAYDTLQLDCAAEDYFDQLFATLAQTNVPVIPKPAAISISGWLDAPWASQSIAIVTSFNEGIVPTTSNTDLFLQDHARHELGLLNNQRRLARDAYALALLRNSRDLTVICKRSTTEGDPLPISRLLLHGPITEQADLIKRFSSGQTTDAKYKLKTTTAGGTLPKTEIQLAQHRPESISVTALRTYLSCPLRYYLSSILKLNGVNDSSKELSPLTFGNLVHGVLHRFGISDVKDSIDRAEIADFLRSTASQYFRHHHGNASYPAVRLQLEQIHHRLDAFADWQAEWRSSGWSIVEVEYQPPAPFIILPEYPECKIHGRVDRIDYNPQQSTYAIFDYKTSESSLPPDKTHKSSQPPGWADLQLPMYRHLCQDITKDCPVKLGYITLGNDLSSIRSHFASWDDAALLDADRVAVDVIKAIRDGEFSRLKENIPLKFDAYAELLGRTALDHPGVVIEEALP